MGSRRWRAVSLGWRKGDELPTLFVDVVPGLEKGQVSDPIRSASGFHLVRLNDRRGGEPIIEQQMHIRHILITPNEVIDDDAAREKIQGIRDRIVAGDDFARRGEGGVGRPRLEERRRRPRLERPGLLRAGIPGGRRQRSPRTP